MSFPELETARLKLVQITEEHTERYFEIMSLDAVTKYYGMESLQQKEQAADIVKSFKTGFESKKSMRWGIVLKETGTLVGTAGLNNLRIGQKRAEIGFEIHPDYWSRGFTSEAARAVIQYAFAELNLYRVGAITFLENKASIGLLEKIGFIKEGVLRGYIYQNGISNDTYIFSMIKSEWEGLTNN
ncbi:N-acetyltransferase [Bacillus salacetis]|uniref:N-acetyltransferase n=1 Tax=Bacillus salacetis TaxID=2315464 RepID=A0A3A1R645_9BACI|nr:GNAT family protein [Bacillus salacetis]RIW38530.1 N-acetyltransferase [Bacillus salacetis]